MFTLPEFLRKLITPVLWAVFVVLFGIDSCCFVEDVLDFLFDLFPFTIARDGGVALDASRSTMGLLDGDLRKPIGISKTIHSVASVLFSD